MEYIYKVHRLPTSDPKLLALLAMKFSALRLIALTVSAAAFSSTFEIESAFSAQTWIERLSRPNLNTFIAVAYAPSTPLSKQTIDAGEWVGSATLLGPYPKSIYEIPESGGPESKDDVIETKWQMTSVYNSPAHRGKGVANMLIAGAIDYATLASKEKGMRMRIMIHPDNAVVKTMYEKFGFVDAGNCTLAEVYMSNGDGNLVPADGGASHPEKYHSRRGLIMEKVVVRRD